MSFYDDPVVDDNAKRSQESVHFVKGLFSEKNGFIYREENPDYGVDLDVELIVETQGASSKKFPVQIKSAITFHKIESDGDSYISYNFKTSRLGYLAKRPPAYGIIALYDETEQQCYFDYVDEVILRLDKHPAREGWREQDSVSILLPLQPLSKSVLPALHEKFLKRHQNNDTLIQEHGQKFNIPYLAANADQPGITLDQKDPEQLAVFLETYGSFLYNEAQYAMLNHLLGLVNRNRLIHSSKLVFLAAITYTRTGNLIDAEYYIRKARKMPAVMQGDGKALIEYSASRVEFMKGNIDHDYFLNEFRSIVDSTENSFNKLNLKINILFFELIKGLESGQFADDFEKQVTTLGQEIELADVPEEEKQMLRCHHADSQFHFAVRAEAALYREFKFKDAMGCPMPMPEKQRRAFHIFKLIEDAEKAVHDAFWYAKEKKDMLLMASAAFHMGQHFFARQVNLLMIAEEDKDPQDKAKVAELFERNQYYSLLAYNEFRNLNMFQNAHESLCTGYEINQMCIFLTEKSIGPNKSAELLTIIRQIEESFDLPPFQSKMDEWAIKLKKS